MVQWLGLGAFTAKGPGSIPGWGTKNPQATWCGQKKKKKKELGPKTYRRNCPLQSCKLDHEKLSILLKVIFKKRVSLLVVKVSTFPTTQMEIRPLPQRECSLKMAVS